MKKLILLFTALICISLTSCTVTVYDRKANPEQETYPDIKEFYLPAGYELIGVSFKGGISCTPVFVTQPMAEDYIPQTKVFFEPEFHDSMLVSTIRVIETK